jgi:hypothetical protein
MRRMWTLVPVLLALAGCATPAAEPASRSELPFEVVAFHPDGAPVSRTVSMSDRPIDPDVLAGWTAASRPSRPPIGTELVAGEPDTTYVFASWLTGCTTAEDVGLKRDGVDLTVTWTRGRTTPTCLRAMEAYVVLAVPSSAVEGVQRINGLNPVDANGPGRLRAFVELGPARGDAPPPAVLGSPEAEALRALGGPPEAAAALDEPVAAGSVGYAFALPGCAAEDAVLVIRSESVDATPVGGETARCTAPTLYLAVFEVPTPYVPAGAVLGG